MSARNVTGSEIDARRARRQNSGAEGAGDAVHEYGARRYLGPGLADADNCRIMNVELHWHIGATLVGVAVRAQAIAAGSKIQRNALRLSAIVTTRGETEIAAADETIERFRPRSNRTGYSSESQQEHGSG